MRHPWIVTLMVTSWIVTGCSKAPEAPPTAEVVKADKAPQEAQPKAAPTAKAAPAQEPAAKVAAKASHATPPPKAPKRPASKLVAWDSPLAWHDWDAGLAKAKAEKKPIMVLVYADW